MAITSDGMLLGPGIFQELRKKLIEFAWIRGKRGKIEDLGLNSTLYPGKQKWNRWFKKRFTNIENKQNFMTIKVDHVGSSYREVSKQNDERSVGNRKNSR